MSDLAIRNGFDLNLLLEKANDLPIEKLERFIQLKNAEEDRRRKDDFDLNFAAMQKDYIPAQRDKMVMDKEGIKVLYKFCPLENILRVYQPIISAHGFSFRWEEEGVKDGEKRVWCIVSGYGHSERTYVDIPIGASTSFTNAAQQRGVSTSYGKRYSLINAFGIIIEDEDTDAKADERRRERKADKALEPFLVYCVEGKKESILDRWDNASLTDKPGLYKIIRGEIFVDLISPMTQAKVTTYQAKWAACSKPDAFLAVLSEASNEGK
jgi:hypothetical protein